MRRPVAFGLNVDPNTGGLAIAARIAATADASGLEYAGVQDHPYNPGLVDTLTQRVPDEHLHLLAQRRPGTPIPDFRRGGCAPGAPGARQCNWLARRQLGKFIMSGRCVCSCLPRRLRNMPGAAEAGVRAQRCRCKTYGLDTCLLAVVGVANGAESS